MGLLALYVIIIFSIVEIGLLIMQNRNLKLEIARLSGAEEYLVVGDKVDAFKVKTMDGVIREIRFNEPSKRYLLFILSTTCNFCEKNLPKWLGIAENIEYTRWSNLWISVQPLDETKDYVERKKLAVGMLAVEDSTFRRSYKIYGVPQTIIINNIGTVENIWIGELAPEHLEEIKMKLESRALD